MANTIQLKLLKNKTIIAEVDGKNYAYEGGYKIIAGEKNATKFEIVSVPNQYTDAVIKIECINALKKTVEPPVIKDNRKFDLPIGMAVAGYGQINITLLQGAEIVPFMPLKIKVWNTNPDWKDYVLIPSPITIGSVTTLPAGENATVTNVGTAEKPILNFGIPQGKDGNSPNAVTTDTEQDIKAVKHFVTEDGAIDIGENRVTISEIGATSDYSANGFSARSGSIDSDTAYRAGFIQRGREKITIPVKSGAMALTQDLAALGASIKLTMDTKNYILTLNLVNSEGKTLSTQSFDFPLESVVVNGAYESITNSLILTLQNGNTIDIPLGDIISGLATTEKVNALEERVVKLEETKIEFEFATNEDIMHLFYDPILEKNSWSAIKQAQIDGIAKNLWKVGDTKSVHIEGTIGTLAINDDFDAVILGFDHNSEFEGTGITFGLFQKNGKNIALCDGDNYRSSTDGTKLFNINHWGDDNYGGWEACDLRYDILGSTDIAPDNYGFIKTKGVKGYAPTNKCTTSPVHNTLMSALPLSLRYVMKPTVKYTDNVGWDEYSDQNVTATTDYLFLFSQFEVLGNVGGLNSNSDEKKYQKQYDYFASNSLIRYDNNGNKTSSYWNRSPRNNMKNYFCYVNSSGSKDSGYSSYALGLCVGFVVG